MNAHNVFMKRALTLATESAKRGTGPFGAVVVKDGDIVAEGWNQVTENNDPSAHAEIQAIRKACKLLKTFRLSDCDIYTSSFPCPMCLGAITWAHTGQTYYANDLEEAKEAGFDDVLFYKEVCSFNNERARPLKRVLLPDEKEAFSVWRNSPNHLEY